MIGIEDETYKGYTLGTTTADIVGYATGIGAITDAFMAYQAGKMKKLAYEHEAAMAEINAKQIGINAQFVMADKTDELAQTLAMQNVMAAATGRKGGGSQTNITQTSIQNLKKEEQRMKLTNEGKRVSTLMGATAARAAGSTAATTGLISGVSALGTGLGEAAQYFPKGS